MDWLKFDQENFLLDYFSVDWENLLKSNELIADNSTQMYSDQITMLSDTYALLKTMNKYKLKFSCKPWVTLGLQKSTSFRNKQLRNFINKEDLLLRGISY